MPADRLFHPRLGHGERVSLLSHLEFRVWHTYITTADDYGVMRKSAVTIQAADDSLAKEKSKAIEAALKRLVDVGLVEKFVHQGRTYIFQTDWQNYQRVKHPRDTMQPLPPDEQIALCTSATRKLFAQHPTKNPKELGDDLGNISEVNQKSSSEISEAPQTEKSEFGSLACARTREMANGYRLMANGLEGVQGDALPMDLWARELVNLYPGQGRCGWNLVERPLFKALTEDSAPLPPAAAWEALKARLAQHKRSHQWRMKGMIPRLDRWLSSGAHLQELPEDSAPAERLSKSTNVTLDAAAAILNKRPA